MTTLVVGSWRLVGWFVCLFCTLCRGPTPRPPGALMRAVQRTGLAVEWGGQGLRGAPAVPLVCGGGRPPPTGSGRPVHHKHHASPIVRVRSSQRWRLRWRGSAIPTRGGSGLAAAAPRTTARGRPPPARPDTIPRGRSRAAVNTDGLALRGAVAREPLECLALHCGPLGGRHLCAGQAIPPVGPPARRVSGGMDLPLAACGGVAAAGLLQGRSAPQVRARGPAGCCAGLVDRPPITAGGCHCRGACARAASTPPGGGLACCGPRPRALSAMGLLRLLLSPCQVRMALNDR